MSSSPPRLRTSAGWPLTCVGRSESAPMPGTLPHPGHQQPRHLVGAHDRPGRRLLHAAAVAEHDHVRRQDVDEPLEVTGQRRPAERLQRPPGLGRRGGGARAPRRDVRPGPVGDLADRGLALADRLGDLRVLDREDLAQHEDRALGRRQRLQHQQHRHREAVGQLHVLGHVGCGEQGFGQPGADVGLLAAAERPQPGQRLPGGDPHQVRAPFADLGEVDARPAQPGLLEHVLRVGRRAEQLVGDGEEQVPVGDERLRRRVRPGPPAVLGLHRPLLPVLVARFGPHAHRTPQGAAL
ncbi:hypothetical protein M2168_005787 [Streptomyces sp. CZ24]|nr:hypothetical protein [Streptomyces sp. CZ24]